MITETRVEGVAADCDVTQYILDDLYAKAIFIKAGREFQQHTHDHDHLSILASGDVDLYVAGVRQALSAPACIEVKGGIGHKVVAKTDALWYCIHSIPADLRAA